MIDITAQYNILLDDKHLIRFPSIPSKFMITAAVYCEEELPYTVSYRQVRRVEREDAPPPGRFETTSSARLARASRYRRGSQSSKRGFQHRGSSGGRLGRISFQSE